MGSKKYRAGRCVFCLIEVQKLTREHVFPRSWYPDSTPPNMEKWQVPSCEPCNHRFGENEEDLLWRFGVCIAPDRAQAAGIPEKVLRSIDPAVGKNEADRAARLARRNKILAERIPTETMLQHMDSIFPGTEPDPQLRPEEMTAIPLPGVGINMLTEKLVRGITHKLEEVFIEADHRIDIHVYRDPRPLVGALQRWGVRHERGPGLEVTRASPKDHPRSGLWKFLFWGQVPIFASVLPKEMPPR